jgi:hypothetical protein
MSGRTYEGRKGRTGLVFLVDGQYRFGGLALLIMHILYICHYAFILSTTFPLTYLC